MPLHFVARLMAIALTLSPLLAAQQRGEIVSGQVVGAFDHKPIPGADIVLRDVSSTQIAAETVSDEEGRFHLAPVPASRYHLSGSAAGYITSTYLQHEQYSTAIVTGAGLDTRSLVLELMPAGRITGRVVDENGDPLQAGASVSLFHQSPDTGEITRANGAQLHDDGQYSFERLAPGVYFIAVSGTPWYAVHAQENAQGNIPQYRTSIDPSLDVAYPMTFYPNATDSKNASPITIHEGDEVSANMQLSPQTAMSVKIEMPAVTNMAQQRPTAMPQLTQTVFGVEEPVRISMAMSSGKEALMIGIPAGQYHLRNIGATGPQGFAPSKVIDLTTTSASVVLSGDAPSAVLTATVHASDGKPFPPKSGISLMEVGANREQYVELDDKGRATFKNLLPGTYRIRPNGPHPFSVLAINLNGNPCTDGLIHIVEGATSLAVDIVASHNAIKIDGIARLNAKPAAGAMVLLVPAGKNTSQDLFRRTQSDLDGGFTFAQVIPGNYLLIAVEDGWKLRYADISALQPFLLHAIPVAIPDNGSTKMHLAEPAIVQFLQP